MIFLSQSYVTQKIYINKSAMLVVRLGCACDELCYQITKSVTTAAANLAYQCVEL